jgi:hypothetical protein
VSRRRHFAFFARRCTNPPPIGTRRRPTTPTALSRKRKHSSYSDPLQSDDEADDAIDASLGTSGRKQRPPGTKRACNQCRQQKVAALAV